MLDYRIFAIDKIFNNIKSAIDFKKRTVNSIEDLNMEIQNIIDKNITNKNLNMEIPIQVDEKHYPHMCILQDICVKPLEQEYFKNTSKNFYHGTALHYLKNILDDGKILAKECHYEKVRGYKGKMVFLSDQFTVSALTAYGRHIDKQANDGGICVIIPDINKNKLHKKIHFKTDKETIYYTAHINKDYTMKELDTDILNKLGLNEAEIIEKCYFVDEDIDIKDIKRIYIISPQLELTHIFNNADNGTFEIFNFEYLNDLIRPVPFPEELLTDLKVKLV